MMVTRKETAGIDAAACRENPGGMVEER